MTDRAVNALQALVRIPTVSHADPAQRDDAALGAFVEEHARRFPLLHHHLERVELPSHALLLRWPGAGDEAPVVLMAHIDVVPVDDDSPWQHPAYGGDVVDGVLWGRGTLDDKGQVVAVSEAVEGLLEQDFVPARDVWLSFGTSEEVSGETAQLAAAELRERGVAPWFVLDEGGAVAAEAFPGVRPPVAVIGVSEKGTTTLELRVDGRGGHASTPVRKDATARLARAIVRLDARPMRSHVPAPTRELFRRLSPHLPRALRPAVGGPLLGRVLAMAGAEPAAMVRTTLAVTTLSGAPAPNVIASTARAGINVRVLPGDTVDDVVAHVRRVVRDDAVQVRVVEAGEASPVSPTDEAFALLGEVVGEVFPDAVVAPYVMNQATDARHFAAVCPRVYRFAPFRMSQEQRQSIHSYDERIGVDALAEGVRWYRRLIERL
ncbi:M20/M25/M40 family metallo-hydrolase [Nocardioides mangrovicus]|uniref:M20/M25/M40 family metallo-hydrolase n=1 Tax=Nocardioides mangrovicus TaxID=2478913 RepID=A0A3L8P0H8_9ACTN|nr:M20/M25/M40 family metallo-hydrolase [Nocardioides mangrovicus]RLV47878.1 M20/M25/M40 family metallo-hydrolase [Nocardioides mangrovicus]